MSRTRCFVGALAVLAASCGGGGDAVIERQVSADPVDSAEATVCGDIRTLALGAHAGPDIDPVIDELGRLSAVLGANDALPHLAEIRSAIEEDREKARPLDAAAEIMDTSGYAACEIPVFTALYVSTSFSSCFGRAPIAAGMMTPDSTGCEADISPTYLPCFDADAGYVPVDCRTNTPVVLRDRDWVPAALG